MRARYRSDRIRAIPADSYSAIISSMDAADTLARARHRAGFSQRELARRAEVPQSTVGRIESGAVEPRISTLGALLRACGEELVAQPLLGRGIDRSLIRRLLELTPDERLDLAAIEARNLQGLLASRR